MEASGEIIGGQKSNLQSRSLSQHWPQELGKKEGIKIRQLRKAINVGTTYQLKRYCAELIMCVI